MGLCRWNQTGKKKDLLKQSGPNPIAVVLVNGGKYGKVTGHAREGHSEASASYRIQGLANNQQKNRNKKVLSKCTQGKGSH